MIAGRGPHAGRPFVRALLRLYPASFRARFGREMEQVIHASRCERPHESALAFWTRVAPDIAAGAIRERVTAVRDWRRERARLALARTHDFDHQPSTQGDGMS